MRTLILLTLCLASAYEASVGERAEPEKVTFHNHRLIEITPTTTEQVNVLRELGESGHLGLDYWLDPFLNHITRVRVPPNVYDRFVEIINDADMTHKVVVEDVQEMIDNPPTVSAEVPRQYFTGSVNHAAYHSLTTINNYIQGFAASFTGASWENLGHKTALDASTRCVKITAGGSNKRAIVIEAGIHAREWISPASIMYFIDRMLHKKDVDEDAMYLYNNFDWYIVPVANPDGYVYTHETNRLWRKNRRFCSGSGTGVDLNRNFDANWGGSGSSGSCSSDTYRGTSAFSEAESMNMRDLVQSLQNSDVDIAAYISVHSYSQYLLVPYAFSSSITPPSNTIIRDITNQAKAAILGTHNVNYIVGSAPEILYVASGGSADWATYRKNISYSMTYELRPSSGTFNGFVLNANQIIPTGEEVWASLYTIATQLYRLP